MGKLFSELDEGLRAFISRQAVFFVATAPQSADGHINLSPKGLDTFRILGPRSVGYLDLTGSGIETVAHLRENGRITVMFCAFEGTPRILRLYGRGRAVLPQDGAWPELYPRFPHLAGVRSIVTVEVERIADSCGFGVPLYSLAGQRSQLTEWAERKGSTTLALYRSEKNRASIDGIAGLD